MTPRYLGIGLVDDQGRIHLDDPVQQRKFCAEYLNGDEIEIEIRKRRSKRSLRQNSWLHAAIEPLAEHLGYDIDDLKLDLLGITFGWKEMKSGNKVPNKLHTSDLNTEEFSDLMAVAQRVAAEEGVVILDPSQYKAAKRKAERKAAKAA